MSDPRQQIEAYLDGVLSAADRAEFERALAASPELAREVELARRIDETLRRRFVAPDPARFIAAAQAAPSKPVATIRWRALAIAAVIGLVAIGAVRLLPRLLFPTELSSDIVVAPRPRQTVAEVYAAAERRGFTPDWVCSNRDEFIWTFSYRLDQGLALKDDLPAGVRMSGLCYAHVFSLDTIYMIGTVNDTPALVFVDRAAGAKPPVVEPPLNVYRQEIRDLVLYEVSSLDRPYFLDHFEPTEPITTRPAGAAPPAP